MGAGAAIKWQYRGETILRRSEVKNKNSSNMLTTSIAILTLSALSACAPKTVDDLPPAAQGTGYGTPTTSTANQVIPGSQQDFVASVSSDRVFFDTDRFNIDVQDQATLQSQAQWLAANPNVRITVEGHADERGTRDYNLALGERRANAAKNFLVSLGVSPARIQTVSYGKERPQALGSNETAWAQNRRAVTIVVQ